MRVAAYTRVSTEEQTEGYSLESQLSQIKHLCQMRGWMLVKEYIDPGFSGGNMDRPGLTDLLDFGSKEDFDLVLITNIDRLSRELSDMWPIIKQLREKGIGLAVTSIPDITSLSKEFYLAYGGMTGMTQYFRENLKEITGRGIKIAKEKGKHLGRPPRGFTLTEDGYLQPDELGLKAIQLLKINPEIKLATFASELKLVDVNQAYKLKASCLKHGNLNHQ